MLRDGLGPAAAVPDRLPEGARLRAPGAWDAWACVRRDVKPGAHQPDQPYCPAFAVADAEKWVVPEPGAQEPDASSRQQMRLMPRQASQALAEPYTLAADLSAEQSFAELVAVGLCAELAAARCLAFAAQTKLKPKAAAEPLLGREAERTPQEVQWDAPLVALPPVPLAAEPGPYTPAVLSAE